MDIFSFTLGICAVTVVALVTGVVVGMFRIKILNKELDRAVKEIEQVKRVIDSRVDSLRSLLEKEDLNLHQRIDNMFTYIDSQDRDLHQRCDELERHFTSNK
jgi:predicted  nucleic acid-binding Zn-ribbon protein